ncbi:ROK family glucokinase [Clostridium beijerinckii]|uniref:Glucokinase n=1 Tax=Clostridium beijerinckii TaxID=1520 RepID=A0AAW3W409_CLOBE|nr:ROK family glucokinase [Clostridium beijerinckii]MBC2455766.1 ROK family glucokinase [Clostridium beijerinckii]MBC2473243.1 ROK family glucokinase [Clostridium beijerinckii]MDG5852770.1 ROK family glucokinase [Clostridium beijerinckii]NOV62248.1 glucokinase [Clostridium beijerinckii]NOV68255.1 glucokinase [Clostridium beijerinckii]
MEKYIFGVDIGGTTVKLGLFETEGTLLEKWEIKTRKEEKGKYIIKDIVETIENKLNENNISKTEVLGIGIGVPGPVKDDGTVLKCVNLGWKVFNIVDQVNKLVKLPIKAANDANVAALGEMWRGGGKGYKNAVMVTLGTGVGSGIIVDGKIISGSNGAGGEIGHIKVSDNETECCGCGNKGCLEQYASATGIVSLANKALKNTKTKSDLKNFGNLSAKDIFDSAKAGDELALELVDDFGNRLGKALANIACVIDPEIFVIGGGVSKNGSFLIESITKYFKENAFHISRNTKFELAKLGNDAGIYGAARLICEN